MESVRIKVAAGKKIRNPQNGKPLHEGVSVSVKKAGTHWNYYWIRRLEQGDVELVNDSPAPKQKKKKKEDSEKDSLKEE